MINPGSSSGVQRASRTQSLLVDFSVVPNLAVEIQSLLDNAAVRGLHDQSQEGGLHDQSQEETSERQGYKEHEGYNETEEETEEGDDNVFYTDEGNPPSVTAENDGTAASKSLPRRDISDLSVYHPAVAATELYRDVQPVDMSGESRLSIGTTRAQLEQAVFQYNECESSVHLITNLSSCTHHQTPGRS